MSRWHLTSRDSLSGPGSIPNTRPPGVKRQWNSLDRCPFCKKRSANAPMVAVQFVGADGKVIPLDARKLFGVQKGQEVVVSGQGVFDPKLAIPIIQLTADAIHVRKPAKK